MNVLFWILEVINVLLLGIPIWARFYNRSKKFFVSKYGLYFSILVVTGISMAMKYHDQDCNQTLMMVAMPVVIVFSENLTVRAIKATEINL